MVERIVAAALRAKKGPVDEPDSEEDENGEADEAATLPRVLLYRAGCETQDRVSIQRALTNGGSPASSRRARGTGWTNNLIRGCRKMRFKAGSHYPWDLSGRR